MQCFDIFYENQQATKWCDMLHQETNKKTYGFFNMVCLSPYVGDHNSTTPSSYGIFKYMSELTLTVRYMTARAIIQSNNCLLKKS